MRPIKFRGKTADGEWVYGDYHHRADGEYIIEWQPTDEGKVSYVITSVVPDTLGMFTGLYDSKGNEIYGGDILAIHHAVVGVVVDGVRGYCFDVNYKNHPAGERRWSLYATIHYDYKGLILVHGNIHDNPELMEG